MSINNNKLQSLTPYLPNLTIFKWQLTIATLSVIAIILYVLLWFGNPPIFRVVK